MHAVSPVYQCLSTLAFRRWTNEEHQRLGDKYRQLTAPIAHKNFVKEHATCYSELSCLPYFNLVEQVVIDPMHNLFLGMPSLYPGLYCTLT